MAKNDVKYNKWMRHFKTRGIIFNDTTNLSHEEWLKIRNTYVALGGSDTGTLFGLNPWLSAVELFYRKVGFYTPANRDSEAAFHGRNQEPYIRNLWRHHSINGEVEETMLNYANKIETCECVELEGIITNPKYPNLMANTDGGITNHFDFPGKLGILECKQISHRVAEMWENGIPPAYIFQTNQYALVLDVDHINLASLKDGMFFSVHTIPVDKDIQGMIIQRSEDFMDRVRRGIVAVESLEDESEQLFALQELEPEYGDDPELLLKFYSELHKEKMFEAVEENPSPIAFDLAKKHKELSDLMKLHKKQQAEVKVMIQRYMNDVGVNKVMLGDNGSITWRTQLRVNYKD